MDQETADARKSVQQVLEGNPAYRHLYGALVTFCAEERPLEEAQRFCDDRRTSPSQILSASALVDVMVRAGALRRTILVDGAPYEGTLEEFRADEAVPEDAAVAVSVRATEAGLSAAAAQREERSLDRLIADHPGRAAAFRQVVAWCADGGRVTSELQELLKAADLLETEAARGIDGLHASYFTGALESVGALAWNGRAWIAADEGRAALVAR